MKETVEDKRWKETLAFKGADDWDDDERFTSPNTGICKHQGIYLGTQSAARH